MVVDNTMKTNSKLRQNHIDVLAIETKTNNTQLTVHVLYDFITSLSVNNTHTEYKYFAYSMTTVTHSSFHAFYR